MGQGSQSQFCVDDATPFDASSIPFEFIPPFGLKGSRDIVNTSGVRGTRSAHSLRSRLAGKTVAGDIVLPVSALMLDWWFPKILGANASGTSFAVAETIPEFVAMIDAASKVFSYTGCKVSKAVFRGSAQSPLITCTLSIIGKDYSIGNSGTFPALAMPVDLPYLFNELVLTVDGTSRECEDFELTIDNVGEARRGNDFAATAVKIKDRIVTLAFTNPFESTDVDLLSVAIGGMAASLVWTPSGGDCSTTITLPCLQIPVDLPTIQGKDQITNRITAVARRTDAAAEISVTHDSDL